MGFSIPFRFPRFRRCAGAGLIAAVALLVPENGSAARTIPKFRIRGSVIDEDGQPVGDLTVWLLKTRSLIQPGKLALESQVVEAGRVATDGNGFFELEADRDSAYRGYFLRFYDPKGFDAVRFRIPEDRDITRKWRGKRPIIVTAVLRFSEQWPEVRAWIARYGPDSPAARLLQSLGLPDQVADSDREGVVDWCFDAPGICYHLKGNEVLGQERRPGAGPNEPEEG